MLSKPLNPFMKIWTLTSCAIFVAALVGLYSLSPKSEIDSNALGYALNPGFWLTTALAYRAEAWASCGLAVIHSVVVGLMLALVARRVLRVAPE